VKKISIAIPAYNEEENIVPLCEEIVELFKKLLPKYDYEVIICDNHSSDQTRDRIIWLCGKYKKIKAIFNVKNFGADRNAQHALLCTSGDASILMMADFQTPTSLIVDFVKAWEEGHKIVCAIKKESKENGLMFFLRSVYYKMIKKMSDVEQIEHFNGFGLYDRSFIELLQKLEEPIPWLRGMVAEFGSNIKYIYFTQPRRRAGKSSFNLYRYYDLAMTSFTAYTKVGMRLATISGFIIAALSILSAIVYIALRIAFRSTIPMGIIPLMLGVFVLGGLQMFFTGLVGEYVMTINTRVKNRPLVVEERRINFKESKNRVNKNI
jgi:polyisoprenyl-phosphate glycosyltransferase